MSYKPCDAKCPEMLSWTTADRRSKDYFREFEACFKMCQVVGEESKMFESYNGK